MKFSHYVLAKPHTHFGDGWVFQSRGRVPVYKRIHRHPVAH